MPILKDGELYLYGFVGDDYWGEGFTATQVVDALIEVGRGTDIAVHINSGGGYTDDGVAIFNALTAHKGRVTVFVDAMAASSASIIAMAGDKRIMLAGSMMMIHDPSGLTWGTAGDHATTLDHLEKLADAMADIYADASGEPSANLRKDMKETLWLTADEAVERGFATGNEDEPSKSVAAFDYRVFANAPERLCALAEENAWSLDAAVARKAGASATAHTGQKGDSTLSNKTVADKDPAPTTTVPVPAPDADAQAKAVDDAATAAVAADRQRRTDILELDETEGREALAETLFATDLTIDQVKAALTAAASTGGSGEAGTGPAAYDAERVAANGQALPAGGADNTKAKIDRGAIFAARREQMEGNKS